MAIQLPSNKTLQPIPAWWQLPFATALILNGYGRYYCHLCGLHPIKHAAIDNMAIGSHNHWFNRLAFICQACQATTDWQAAAFSFDIIANNSVKTIIGKASTAYHFPWHQVMRRLKNSHELAYLPLLVHAVRQLAKPPQCTAHNSVIIAVPSTIGRLKQRGFDPLLWLTHYLSFHWQIPQFIAVARDERQHQQGLSRAARLDNVKDAFFFAAVPNVPKIILFDDVVTTGATLQALAQALIQHAPQKNYTIHAYSILHGD